MQPYVLKQKLPVLTRCKRYIISIYTLSKVISKGKYWLLSDAKHHADDNAEHFYRYLMINKPEQNIVFLLSTKSPDWQRLEDEGFQLVAFSRYLVDKAVKNADKVLVSHTDLIERYSPAGLSAAFIYLGHGIKKDNDDNRLGNIAIDIVVSGAVAEYAHLSTHKPVNWKHVFFSGLPRHDALSKFFKQYATAILLMPTWRKYIPCGKEDKFGINSAGDTYFQAWAEVLNSQKLKALADNFNVEIYCLPHRVVSIHAEKFNCPGYVHLLIWNNLRIQEVFKKTRVLITDFSSVAFDFACLHRSVVYYQFDADEYRKSHYQAGYFNYETDGFGPVCHSLDELHEAVSAAFASSAPYGQYLERMQKDFPRKDGCNCARLFDFISTTNITK